MQPEPGRSQEQQVAIDDLADSEDDDEDEEETEYFGVRGLESRFFQAPLAVAPRSPTQPRGLRALLTRFLIPSRFLRRPVEPRPQPEQPARPQPLKSRFDKSVGPKL